MFSVTLKRVYVRRLNGTVRLMTTLKKSVRQGANRKLPKKYAAAAEIRQRVADRKTVEKAHDELRLALDSLQANVLNVPCIIGNEIHFTEHPQAQQMPHKHERTLATFTHADTDLIAHAIEKSQQAQQLWSRVDARQRAKIWLNCAKILETEDNALLIASMVLGQATTPAYAQRDVTQLIVDLRRTAKLLTHMSTLKFKQQANAPHIHSTFHVRPLNGFVAAISPFNSTCLAATLALQPALMGNAVLWQPHDNAVLSNYIVYQAMLKAGLPPSVISFMPCAGDTFADQIIKSPHLGGINFAGHASQLRSYWRAVGCNLNQYKCFPRVCGECSGKNFHFVHSSAEPVDVAKATIGAAFEFAGQQLSSCSRLYVPSSIWQDVRNYLVTGCRSLKIGSPAKSHVSAVINRETCERIASYLLYAHVHNDVCLLSGGRTHMQSGYFNEPTIIQCYDPQHFLMSAEIHGPVLCVYVYDDADVDEVMETIVDTTSLALSGSVFGRDGGAVLRAMHALRMAASNLYINERCTGPGGNISGHQLSRFGGTGFAGTNDRSSLTHTLMHWCTPQLVEQNIATKLDMTEMRQCSKKEFAYVKM